MGENTHNITLSDIEIQWHPAFCAATELELMENRGDLDFLREYSLSKKPQQIDLLVVRKRDDVSIENEIGHIFRHHNIIEFKSPGDGMSIDDFFKTVGYALQYKSLGETVDEIPIDQLTVSMVREAKPEEMFRSLEKYGFPAEKKSNGIYYVGGTYVPAQVIVTKELDGGKHRSLRVLSRSPEEEDVRVFVEESQKLTVQGDLANVDAILQVSVSANFEFYRDLMGRYPDMSEAMRVLMHDEIAKSEARGEARGRAEGRVEGRAEGRAEGEMKKARETAYELVDMGLSVEKIAQAVKVKLETVQQWFAERPTLAE